MEEIWAHKAMASGFYDRNLREDTLRKGLRDVVRLTDITSGDAWAWCSDWPAYKSTLSTPVLYFEAHHDIVMRDGCAVPPLLFSEGILESTGQDNRASCMAMHEFCRVWQLNRDVDPPTAPQTIIYCLWSDREETDMKCMREWFAKCHRRHDGEFFVVLDVLHSNRDALGRINLGKGVYKFQDDPLDTFLRQTDLSGIMHQSCLCVGPWPDPLKRSHGEVIFEHTRRVGRLCVPVYGAIAECEKEDPLHAAHAFVSLSDVEQMYAKMWLIAKKFNP